MKALAFSGGKDSMACLFLMKESIDFAIYVDTGYSYPETTAMVEIAKKHVPVHVVNSDRYGQNEFEGIPADIVPINWTRIGHTITGEKPVKIQSYLGCCHDNISRPLLDYAKQNGVTTLIYGQRKQESYKSPAVNGDVIEGIVRLQPIESWTTDEVMAYLATKMQIPEHFRIKHSSLDCYDCTAFSKDSADRIEFTRNKYPEKYSAYKSRHDAVSNAIAAEMN